jgi:hypothetical protein
VDELGDVSKKYIPWQVDEFGVVIKKYVTWQVDELEDVIKKYITWHVDELGDVIKKYITWQVDELGDVIKKIKPYIKWHLLLIICNFFVPCNQPVSSKQLSENRHMLLKHPVQKSNAYCLLPYIVSL